MQRKSRGSAVVIDLPKTTLDALIRMAVREDRDVAGQARRLVTEGLVASGMLADSGQR